MTGAAEQREVRLLKIQAIFGAADSRGFGKLCKDDLGMLVSRSNPGMLREDQMGIIVDEMLDSYGTEDAEPGLTLEGLKKIYEVDGNVDNDFRILGLALASAESSKGTRFCSQVEKQRDSPDDDILQLSQESSQDAMALPQSTLDLKRRSSGAESLPEVGAQRSVLRNESPTRDGMQADAYEQGITGVGLDRQGGRRMPRSMAAEEAILIAPPKSQQGTASTKRSTEASMSTVPCKNGAASPMGGKVAMLVQNFDTSSSPKSVRHGSRSPASPAGSDNSSRRALWGQQGWSAPQIANGRLSPSSSAISEAALSARDSPRLRQGGVGSNAMSAGAQAKQTGKTYQARPMLDFLDTEAEGHDKPTLESPSGLSTKSFQSARAFVGDAARQSWRLLNVPPSSQTSADRREIQPQRMMQQTIDDFGEEQDAEESANHPVTGNKGSLGQRKGPDANDSKDFRVTANGKSGTSIRHFPSDSRSEMGSIIRAYKDSVIPDFGPLAMEDDTDDIYDEVETSPGVIQKFPSAVSIEARGFNKQGSSVNSHSRAPSLIEAEDITEAARSRNLTVFVPPEASKVVDHEAAVLLHSPGSSTVAEKDAQVGYESLDSPIAAAFNPEAQKAGALNVSADEVWAEIQSAAESKTFVRILPQLREKIQAVADKPRVYALHAEVGRLLAKRQHHGEAIEVFEEASTFPQADTLLYFRLGNSLFHQEHLVPAENNFKHALQILQRDGKFENNLAAKVLTNLGLTQEAQGHLFAACDSYRQAYARNRRNARVLKMLGGALYSAGELTSAKTALQDAIALQTNFPDAWCDLGCALAAGGESTAAREAFLTAIQQDEKHAEAWFNLGNLDRKAQKLPEALSAFTTVLKLQPGHWKALLHMAVTLIGLGRQEEAQSALKQALQISGEAGNVSQEVRSLKSLAQSGASHEQLSRAATSIFHKTANVPSPLPKQRPVSERLPSRASNAARLQGSADGLAATVDLVLLRKLSDFARVPLNKTAAVCKTATQAQLNLSSIEILARELLPGLRPKSFSSLLRTVHQQVLPYLKASPQRGSDPSTTVDGTMLALVLLAISSAPWEDRAGAMMAAILDQPGKTTAAKVTTYLSGIRAVFGVEHEDRGVVTEGHNRGLQPPEIFRALTDSQIGFPALPLLPSLALVGAK